MGSLKSATLLIIASIIILALSLRGQLGNPDATQLSIPSWRENGPFELSPERGRFALTYTIVNDRSFILNPSLAQFAMPDVGKNKGKFVSLFAPGVSFLIAPGYWIGRLFGASQIGAFSVIALLALINSLLIFRLVNKLTSHSLPGVIAGLIFLFASPAYSYATTIYQHHVSTLLILLSLTAINSTMNFWTLGIIWFLCAMSFLVDYPNSVLMFPIGIASLLHIVYLKVRRHELHVSLHLRRITSTLFVFLPLVVFLWYNQTAYGNPLQLAGTVSNATENDFISPSTTVNNQSIQIEKNEAEFEETHRSATGFFKARNLINGLYILLTSPDRGLIIFTPVLILGLTGIIHLYRKNKSFSVLLCSIVLANLMLYSMWGDPWGGWAFGSRYLIPSYAILAIFLGVFLNHFRKNIVVLLIFLVLGCYSIYVNTAGALSTSANPPQVQVLELEKVSGRRERYSWDRNIEYLQAGSSKSFVYQTWLKDKISAWNYFIVIAGSISALILLLTIGLYFSRTSEN